MNRELRERLIEAAKTPEGFVHYDEVARILGLTPERLDHCQEIFDALGEISTYEHENRRPLLSAVVVRKDDLSPGEGFFKMAKRMKKQKPGKDNDAFFLDELRRVREHWRSTGE